MKNLLKELSLNKQSISRLNALSINGGCGPSDISCFETCFPCDPTSAPGESCDPREGGTCLL